MLKNAWRMWGLHISTYENLHAKQNVTVFAKQTRRRRISTPETPLESEKTLSVRRTTQAVDSLRKWDRINKYSYGSLGAGSVKKMSRKQNFYLSDEDQKEFEARFVEAVATLKRDVSKSELIVKHLRKSYKIPIIEVMQ